MEKSNKKYKHIKDFQKLEFLFFEILKKKEYGLIHKGDIPNFFSLNQNQK